jgi:hypothetical protein
MGKQIMEDKPVGGNACLALTHDVILVIEKDKRGVGVIHESMFSEAHRINKFDLYSGLNVARLNLLLSKWDSNLLDQAKEGFRKQVYLCRHTVEEDTNDYWRLFDLADTLLFSGEPEESQTLFNRAVGLVPIDERKDKLLSVLGPLRDYLAAGVLNEPLRGKVEGVVNELESARGAI